MPATTSTTELNVRRQWSKERLDMAEEVYTDCARCPALVDTGWWMRNKLVFGEGAYNADILFVGIGPGEHEDAAGVPFVGPSGNLIDDILIRLIPDERLDPYRTSLKKQLSLDEWREVRRLIIEIERVYYTNLVCCRPVQQDYDEHKDTMFIKNRDPSTTEIKTCSDRLLQTIYALDPILIVTMGLPTLTAFRSMDVRTGLGSLSMQATAGRILDIHLPGLLTPIRYPVLALYHPAYLLRMWDEKDENGYVQSTARSLARAFQIVDRARFMLRRTPIPKRTTRRR